MQPSSFTQEQEVEGIQLDVYMRDLDQISGDENPVDRPEENTNTISIQRASDAQKVAPFKLIPASDTESEPESGVEDEGRTSAPTIVLDDELTGKVKYIKLGAQRSSAKGAPPFMKLLLDYFNAKLRAMKLDLPTTGTQWVIAVTEAERYIREYYYARYCGRCQTTIGEATVSCNCVKFDPSAGSVYIRADQYMRDSLHQTLYTDPKTLSFAMERALTMMNSVSYDRIIDKFAIIGLDCEMWNVMTKRGNRIVNETIDVEYENHYVRHHDKMHPGRFKSWQMVVEAGADMIDVNGVVTKVFNEKFRVPRTWLEPQLIHPAAHRVTKEVKKLITYFIQSSPDQQEEDALTKELDLYLNYFADLARFPGGVSYTKYPHLVKAFDYMDDGPNGYQGSLWMSMLLDKERRDYPSAVRTKPKERGGLSAYIVSRGGMRCCFDARNILNDKLKKLPPGVIVVYSGENDFDALSCFPEGDHVIMDIVWMPAVRYLIKHIEEWKLEGMDMVVHPCDLFDLRQVQLVKLSKLWIALTKPTPEAEKEALEGAHSAAFDARMTREVFAVVMAFRKKNSAIFDLLSPVEIDRTFYKILMKAAFDKETQGPKGGVKQGIMGKRLRQVLRTGSLHSEVCGHEPWRPAAERR